MLNTIPPELVSHIALQLAKETLRPPVSLLQSCKAMHTACSPQTNPRLYANVFEASFDLEAAERRLTNSGSGSGSKHRQREDNTIRDVVTAAAITTELRRRVMALDRLRAMCAAEDVSEVRNEDLWVIYIMLIENDGKNIRHLVSPSGLLYLPTFLQLYHKQHLLAAALEPGYPAETEGRSLIMWIAWLLSGYRGDDDEPAELRDERLFVLRPYVFAPQQYELCYAPWTISYLPLGEGSSTSRPGSGIDPAEEANPFVADLKPKARTTRIQHFGQECEISPPILSHAAILRFFSKRKNQTSTAKLNMVAPMQQILSATGQDPIALDTPPSVVGASNNDAEEDDEDDDFGTIRDLISDSRLHDRDFARMKACHDPFTSRGMPRTNWHNSWNGCWEGTFSFFDFDSFREMLAGQSLALYEGPFGEQAQVWRMQETYVWRKSWAQKKEVERAKALEELQAKHREAKRARLERGEPEELSESDESTVTKAKGKEPQRGLPLTGPATNAGFPTDLPPSSSAGLATAEAEATTLKETIQQQVDSLEGYEAVPEHLLEEALAEEDGGEEAGLEMLLTGVGHSAWGRFILKGKVRVWDGMASLVKEYAPDSRGKWIYRGYVLSGDLFVGRWRDTFTPQEYVGYEGTFILHRRK